MSNVTEMSFNSFDICPQIVQASHVLSFETYYCLTPPPPKYVLIHNQLCSVSLSPLLAPTFPQCVSTRPVPLAWSRSAAQPQEPCEGH